MFQFLQNSFIGIIFGVLLSTLVVFAYMSFWWKGKYDKTQDELLELANKNGFFTKKISVMRNDEKLLFDILLKLYGDKYYVFPQMTLSNLLDVKNDFKDHDNLYREIDHRSIDYLFCNRETITPILAIELNGESHKLNSRKNRDKLIKNILTKANIRFLSIEKKLNYDSNEISKTVNNSLLSLSSSLV